MEMNRRIRPQYQKKKRSVQSKKAWSGGGDKWGWVNTTSVRNTKPLDSAGATKEKPASSYARQKRTTAKKKSKGARLKANSNP